MRIYIYIHIYIYIYMHIDVQISQISAISVYMYIYVYLEAQRIACTYLQLGLFVSDIIIVARIYRLFTSIASVVSQLLVTVVNIAYSAKCYRLGSARIGLYSTSVSRFNFCSFLGTHLPIC